MKKLIVSKGVLILLIPFLLHGALMAWSHQAQAQPSYAFSEQQSSQKKIKQPNLIYNYTVGTKKNYPNLVVRVLSINPKTPIIGQEMEVNLELKNTGNGYAEEPGVKVRIQRADSTGPIWYKYERFKSMNPNEVITKPIKIHLKQGKAGKWIIETEWTFMNALPESVRSKLNRKGLSFPFNAQYSRDERWSKLVISINPYYTHKNKKMKALPLTPGGKVRLRRGKRLYWEIKVINHGGLRSIPIKVVYGETNSKGNFKWRKTENIGIISPDGGIWKKTVHERYWSSGEKRFRALLLNLRNMELWKQNIKTKKNKQVSLKIY